MSKKIKITAMTTMCADIFDGTGEIYPGGEALNFAAAACEYPQINVGIVGAIGDDECGRAVLSFMEKHPIDQEGVHIIKGGVTASNRIYLTEEGDRYFKEDSWTNGVYGTFKMNDGDRDILRRSDIVYVNNTSPSLDEAAQLKKSADFKFAVDHDVERDRSRLEKYLPYTDFFFISDSEENLPYYRELSLKYSCLFNITLAAKGSVTYENGKEYRTAAVSVDKVIDTTGCGDSYHGTFICSYAQNGDILTAMKEGSAAAAKTLGHLGGVDIG